MTDDDDAITPRSLLKTSLRFGIGAPDQTAPHISTSTANWFLLMLNNSAILQPSTSLSTQLIGNPTFRGAVHFITTISAQTRRTLSQHVPDPSRGITSITWQRLAEIDQTALLVCEEGEG